MTAVSYARHVINACAGHAPGHLIEQTDNHSRRDEILAWQSKGRYELPCMIYNVVTGHVLGQPRFNPVPGFAITQHKI